MSFHNQNPQDSSKCLGLLIQTSPSVTYLNHESSTIRLQKPEGPRTTFKVFGSPYSPARDLWAFGYQPEKGSELWNQIPLDTDIVITHTPPKHHCDESRSRGAAGCETLRQTLWRVRPRLAVCGHVHEGRAVERVRWDLSTPNIKYKEEHTSYWIDRGLGNNKQSLVDLTVRGGEPLDNDGNQDKIGNPADPATTAVKPNRKSVCWSCLRPGQDKQYLPNDSRSTASQPVLIDASTSAEIETNPIQCTTSNDAASNDVPFAFPESLSPTEFSHEDAVPSTGGEGGLPLSRQCDVEAMTNRMGRKETCIINAAMMASSWPHKGSGGNKYNKPIVVDIDLLVWENLVGDEGSLLG